MEMTKVKCVFCGALKSKETTFSTLYDHVFNSKNKNTVKETNTVEIH